MRNTVEFESPEEEAYCPACGRRLHVEPLRLGLNRREVRKCPYCAEKITFVRRWAVGPTEHK